MTSERDVRDRLAEALRLGMAPSAAAKTPWASTTYPEISRRGWLADAECLLRALPSVGLTISTDPQDDGGRG